METTQELANLLRLYKRFYVAYLSVKLDDAWHYYISVEEVGQKLYDLGVTNNQLAILRYHVIELLLTDGYDLVRLIRDTPAKET